MNNFKKRFPPSKQRLQQQPTRENNQANTLWSPHNLRNGDSITSSIEVNPQSSKVQVWLILMKSPFDKEQYAVNVGQLDSDFFAKVNQNSSGATSLDVKGHRHNVRENSSRVQILQVVFRREVARALIIAALKHQRIADILLQSCVTHGKNGSRCKLDSQFWDHDAPAGKHWDEAQPYHCPAIKEHYPFIGSVLWSRIRLCTFLCMRPPVSWACVSQELFTSVRESSTPKKKKLVDLASNPPTQSRTRKIIQPQFLWEHIFNKHLCLIMIIIMMIMIINIKTHLLVCQTDFFVNRIYRCKYISISIYSYMGQNRHAFPASHSFR